MASQGLNGVFLRIGRLAFIAYQGTSRLRIRDTRFLIGINTALLGLLIYGSVTGREKIKAGRKEMI